MSASVSLIVSLVSNGVPLSTPPRLKSPASFVTLKALRMRLGVTPNLIRKAFKVTKEAGLLRRGGVLRGTPLETKETIRETEALIDEVRPDTVSFSILAPYPGTDYYDPAKHADLNWEEIDEYGGSNPWRTDALSHEDLLSERLRLIEKYRGHLSRIMEKKIALGIINTNEVQMTDFEPDS